MLGIVIGLFNLSDLTSLASTETTQLDQGVDVLLGGVKMAMVASFVGLMLTILNSGFYFKTAKAQIEQRRNGFYTFLQTELLPVVGQTLASTIHSLQRNLLKFNSEFSGNLHKLGGLFDGNYQTLKAQNDILSKLEQLDIVTLSKYNIEVYIGAE